MTEYFWNFIKQKQADGLAKATIDSYCYALRDYYQYLIRNKIESADEETIRDYFIYLRSKDYSQVTIRDKYAVLKAYYNYTVKYGYRTKSPIQLKKPALPKAKARCFTEDEIEKILNFYSDKSTFTKLRDYTIMCLLLATGIRRSELLNIDTLYKDFFVVTGKGRTRSVPISTSLKQVLKPYLIAREKIATCPYLIITKDGKQMTKDGLRACFIRLSNGTGITGKRFSPHTFRHTFATNFLKNNGDLVSLQYILGHSELSTTSIYLSWNDEAVALTNERANPLNRYKKIF